MPQYPSELNAGRFIGVWTLWDGDKVWWLKDRQMAENIFHILTKTQATYSVPFPWHKPALKNRKKQAQTDMKITAKCFIDSTRNIHTHKRV